MNSWKTSFDAHRRLFVKKNKNLIVISLAFAGDATEANESNGYSSWYATQDVYKEASSHLDRGWKGEVGTVKSYNVDGKIKNLADAGGFYVQKTGDSTSHAYGTKYKIEVSLN